MVTSAVGASRANRSTEYHSQAFVDLVPSILERTTVDQIEALDFDTYWVCYSEIGAEPAKWEPYTRETADHSLPFILAVGSRDGSVELDSFSDANIHDPDVRALMPPGRRVDQPPC
jgi:2-methylcitrate dehydratase